MDDLLGQAAVLSARGDVENAIEILHVVIKSNPRQSLAYIQLAEIYENQNDFIRAYEYRHLGCQLNTKATAYDWENAGDMALRIGKLENAANNYSKASRVDPRCWTYYEKMIAVYSRLGLENMVMKSKLSAAQNVDCSEDEFSFEWLEATIKEASNHFCLEDNEQMLLKALRIYIQRSKEYGRNYDRQHEALIKIYFFAHNYTEVIKSILGICDGIEGLDSEGKLAYRVTREYSITPCPPTDIVAFDIADAFPIVMLGRLIQSFFKLSLFDIAQLLLSQLLERSINSENVDVYVGVAEAILEMKLYSEGLQFTTAILQELITEAQLYYLQGCFYLKLDEKQMALDAFYCALDFQDDHVDARINIATVLQEQGDIEAALNVLNDYDLDRGMQLPDERLLIRQVELFWTQKKYAHYVRALRMLLIPYFYEVLGNEKSLLINKRRTGRQFPVSVRKLAYGALEKTPFEALVKKFGAAGAKWQGLTPLELYGYTMKLVEALENQGRYQDMFQVVCLTTLHHKISDVNSADLQSVFLYSALKAKQFRLSFEILRRNMNICLYDLEKGKDPSALSKMFDTILPIGYVFAQHQTDNMQKFCKRLLAKYPDNVRLRMISANNALNSGYYKHAIHEFGLVYAVCPDNPLISLSLSVSFLCLASKRVITARTAIATRALIFFTKYQRLRECCGPKQEIYYNAGRFFHQLGLSSQAVYYYEKTLSEPDPEVVEKDSETGEPMIFSSKKYSLKACAALNYIEIIRHVNPGKARQLRKTYCVL